MDIEDSHVEKFAAVCAEAILTYLDSQEPQWVTWDGFSHRFDFLSVELDPPIMPVVVSIEEGWDQIGDIGEITDPNHEHFDADALRDAIVHLLVEEGVGERILKRFLAKLEKLEEELDEDEGAGGEAPPEED
ncbi:MAG TPA: hypothetical protein VGE22_02805 [Solimonas sp.]